MNKSLLRKAAFQSVALMFAVILLPFAFRHYHSVIISAKDNVLSGTNAETEALTITQNGNDTPRSIDHNISLTETNHRILGQILPKSLSIEEIKKYVDQDIQDKLGERYLIIKKPSGMNISYQIEDLYLTKSIMFTLTGEKLGTMNHDMIERVHSGEIFHGTPQYKEIVRASEDSSKSNENTLPARDYGNDIIHAIAIDNNSNQKTGMDSISMVIEMDSVYVQSVYEDDNYYYIDLRKPKDVYSKVIVIDAGHGGKDAGAPSIREDSYEKDMNLLIALQLKKLLDKDDIKVYYTRLADDTVFLRPRVDLANDVDCDYFISIHNNASTQEWPNGTEILYYDREFKGIKNEDMANIFSNEIGKTITLEPRGLVKKSKEDVFILNHAVVPSVLIEVGYLTNNHDMDYLSKESNRKAAAEGIYNGIKRLYAELGIPECK